MSTRCVIIDDEPFAIKVLETHLARVPDVEVVATCRSALEAFDILRKQTVDLLFLDIQMPELTGLDFLRALAHPPNVILTTAYREYALEGFELDVVDYLLKPISLPRLLRALDKARRLNDSTLAGKTSTRTSHMLALTADRQTVTVALDKVVYIESMGDYVTVHAQGRTIVSKQRIGELAERLGPHGFLRIHRSFLVSMAHITAYSAEEVHIDTETLPISRSYRQTVMARLAAWDV